MTGAVWLVHLGATLAMAGVIWVVQVVHYPLFDRVGREGFVRYHADHGRLITWIVGPLMLAEAATAALLAVAPPAGAPRGALVAGLALVGVAWAATALASIPRHAVLGRGFDAGAHRGLVRTNWLRTAAWTARAALVLWLTGRMLA